METRIDEIGDRIYRLSTFVPDIVPPSGFTFNQFLIMGDDPLLFHTGLRTMFPLVSAAVSRIMPVDKLRWITFGHYEADECGSMNEWLAVAPQAEIAHGMTGSTVSLIDTADRPPRVLSNGEVLDIGGRRIRYIDTPHVPHGWDAGVIYEETSRTLFCGDLFTHVGDGPAVVETEIVSPSLAAEDIFGFTSLGPTTAPTIRRLADLAPRMLAVMHGSSYAGNAGAALQDLAGAYETRLRAAMA
ncbi:MBL fold metallo-hydrolase [Microvirga sp. KLBC 81]|uniref:MBL fold metallo-hydrolase n=1 Tax=Microvirga sp. KLBC 81 TaxID=1862707 RepID=UPI000D51A47B|nr:MBL fold metallo-hydrolase [Microvirga sp. KLBC 81]PVE21845.1 MBL fold metallo-hydrolase [Microvirga sp. KLBC 81]